MLSVCDEGDGLSLGFDPTAIDGSLGMRVVTSLTRQLNGKLVAAPRRARASPGACFIVTFPESRGPHRTNADLIIEC